MTERPTREQPAQFQGSVSLSECIDAAVNGIKVERHIFGRLRPRGSRRSKQYQRALHRAKILMSDACWRYEEEFYNFAHRRASLLAVLPEEE